MKTNLKCGDAVVDILENVIFGDGQEVVHSGDVVNGVGKDPDLKFDVQRDAEQARLVRFSVTIKMFALCSFENA